MRPRLWHTTGRSHAEILSPQLAHFSGRGRVTCARPRSLVRHDVLPAPAAALPTLPYRRRAPAEARKVNTGPLEATEGACRRRWPASRPASWPKAPLHTRTHTPNFTLHVLPFTLHVLPSFHSPARHRPRSEELLHMCSVHLIVLSGCAAIPPLPAPVPEPAVER